MSAKCDPGPRAVGPAGSPRFFNQRRIAYVDNPFDEEASTACIQSCDVNYLQKTPSDRQCKGKNPGDPAQLSTSFSGSSNRSGRGHVAPEMKSVEGEVLCLSGGPESCESDWSCLFTPVQCHTNSPSGEIQLSLTYDPLLETLKVSIIKARGLTCPVCSRKPRNSGIICVGTFIRVSLLLNNNEFATKKTEMKTRKAEIYFYDKFSFRVKNDVIRQCSLQCRAVHKVGAILKRDHVIGQVLIGGDDDDVTRFWREMIDKPKKNITQWYFLRED